MPPPAKTPMTSRTKRSSQKAGNDEDDEGGPGENGAETHSTFIRRMYKPREPLKTLDGPAERFNAPVANMYDPALLIDPALEAGPSSAAASQLPFESILDDNGLQAGTPLFVTPSQLLSQVRDEIAMASPTRDRKRQRPASPSPGPSTRDAAVSGESQRKKAKKAKKVRKPVGDSAATQPSQRPRASAEVAEPPRSRPATTTVPITVYRLSQPVTLGMDDDDDELNGSTHASLSSRGLPPVNPVDVLTQVTSEVIEHMAETAHRLPPTSISSRRSSAAQGSNRKADAQELKRKRAILHHFKQSLSDSLFDVTTALDAGTVLAARLKQLLKEKLQLRDELLTVRAQREEVALKIDRVRRDHATWRTATTRRDELSADLWDLEMAVKQGREECERRTRRGEEVEPPAMGLRMLAASVAETVTGVGEEGGLCGDVTKFNETLERVAGVLEGR
ncbi:MAG: hypothetical protein INR71_13140 [Terriglobus roseus]|nr:hypothetical protein [Terriglobus roseus]